MYNFLLTLGAHARGLQYLFCLCVCVSVCVFPILAPRAIRRTNSSISDPSAVLSTKLGSTLLRKPIATVSLHRQRTSRRQRASHLHRLVNGDVYGSRILIATPTSLSHMRATR